MCYIQEWNWTQCGHRWQGHLLCEDALRHQPPRYCECAHWVQLPLNVPHESQLAPGKTGLCPDLQRHPDRVGDVVQPLNVPPGHSVTRTFERYIPNSPNNQNQQNGHVSRNVTRGNPSHVTRRC